MRLAGVSIRAPAGGATWLRSFPPSSVRFQSALPRGERPPCSPADLWPARRFNPRSRGGSDTTLGILVGSLISFNPRSRGGSDSNIKLLFSYRVAFQSALPRGERPVLASLVYDDAIVSIRAPAGGATFVSVKDQAFGAFQSALPRGERRGAADSDQGTDKFQSALPRGERRVSVYVLSKRMLFQSALPRGERPPRRKQVYTLIGFQSALPRGERLRGGG